MVLNEQDADEALEQWPFASGRHARPRVEDAQHRLIPLAPECHPHRAARRAEAHGVFQQVLLRAAQVVPPARS
ncbi:hypothetical protein DAERI_280005 [Deinococcus aerius]|uniref:Uncharacterized protein n=1 Tax=Deinococcus aerius TaxID=200253 RepID=A0A2I9D113_9DEIO|nr:hypothetical protein DAERI_280005 [Deinococcus aerius]